MYVLEFKQILPLFILFVFQLNRALNTAVKLCFTFILVKVANLYDFLLGWGASSDQQKVSPRHYLSRHVFTNLSISVKALASTCRTFNRLVALCFTLRWLPWLIVDTRTNMPRGSEYTLHIACIPRRFLDLSNFPNSCDSLFFPIFDIRRSYDIATALDILIVKNRKNRNQILLYWQKVLLIIVFILKREFQK